MAVPTELAQRAASSEETQVDSRKSIQIAKHHIFKAKKKNGLENSKDQENPNFSAFDTCGSLSNDPVFDPGRLGKRSDGTEITKLYAKPEV